MDLENLREILNVDSSDDSHDETIISLYALAKNIFTHRTRRLLELKPCSQTFVNVYTSTLYPEYAPLVDVVSVQTKNLTSEAYTDIEIDYSPVNDAIYFDSLVDAKFVDVQYTAGYLTIPTEIEKILTNIVSFLWTYDDRKIVLSGNQEIALAPDDLKLPKIIRENMSIYRVGI